MQVVRIAVRQGARLAPWQRGISRLHSTLSTLHPRAAMRIHLLGAGSTGCLLAVHLQKSIEKNQRQDTITLQVRRPPPAVDKDGKVLVSVYDGNEKGNRQSNLFAWEQTDSGRMTSSKAAQEQIDVLVVTTKADQTIEALKPLAHRLVSRERTRPATLVLVQNGVGLDEEIAKTFGWNNASSSINSPLPFMILGVNSNGTWTKDRFETVHAALATLQLGFSAATARRLGEKRAEQFMSSALDPAAATGDDCDYESLRNTLTLLQSDHFKQAVGASCTVSSAEFAVAQQRKLVSNCVLNPLTALYGIRNGEIRTHAEANGQVEGLLEECARVLAARYRQMYAGQELPQTLTLVSLRLYVWQVITVTQANWSSTVQDMWTGRGRTEIEYLNGTIVRWADAMGMQAATANADMVQKVNAKAKEVQAAAKKKKNDDVRVDQGSAI